MKISHYILTAVLMLLPVLQPGAVVASTDDPGWKTVSDARLTVRYRGPSDVLANQVLERAGTFLTSTSIFLGLPWRSKYSIVIAGSRDEFIQLQPTTRPAPEWAGALTYPGLGMVLIMTPGAMETGGIRYWSLLQHEMAHLLLGDAESRHSTRLPRWFQEGIATYVSGEMTLSWLVQLGWAQATGATPDFRDLEFAFPDQPSRAGAAYARSYLFIKYLSQRFGDDAVALLVAESFQRGGINSGVAAAFDLSLAELLVGFDQYAKVKATWIPIITSTATLWGVITLLLFVTWFRKKIQGMRTVQQWEREEEEERMAASLHDYDDTFHEEKFHEDKRTLH
jgi:hypothetical protein